MWLLVATLLVMRTVGIKVLKNKLSEYIRAAAAGETVQVTDRGRIVAELVAPRVETIANETDAERQWAELVRRGLVRPAKKPRPPLPPRRPAIMTLEEMLRDLDESRSDS
jgi:antitoxin (DNA-binding transcriptional repressor) of toxin-antitoxin stability system